MYFYLSFPRKILAAPIPNVNSPSKEAINEVTDKLDALSLSNDSSDGGYSCDDLSNDISSEYSESHTFDSDYSDYDSTWTGFIRESDIDTSQDDFSNLDKNFSQIDGGNDSSFDSEMNDIIDQEIGQSRLPDFYGLVLENGYVDGLLQNLCYLNSVIQCLFSMTSFRRLIQTFPEPFSTKFGDVFKINRESI